MKITKITMAVTLALSFNNSFSAENDVAVVKNNEKETEKIAIIGTRTSSCSVADSAVPIDIIESNELARNSLGDISSVLSNIVPSYNVSTHSINDAVTMIRPTSLRGLPSDNTLVLVNGKRRHRASVITLTTGGVNNGEHGPGISIIPAIASMQVEVLRDGAAAQYGSDVIAGVINFQLKGDSGGSSFQLQKGQFSF